MGILKFLFGKSDKNTLAGLSSIDIEKKIAEHNQQIELLKRRLPTESAMESRNKSAVWMEEMQEKLKRAKAKGNLDEVEQLEEKVKEAVKKSERIDKHLDEIREQIQQQEDQIELLSNVLAKMK